MAREELDLMVEDGARTGTREVKIGMVGQVHRSGSIGRRFIFDAESIFVGEDIGHGAREIAGIAIFVVPALIGESYGGALDVRHCFAPPGPLV